jgi:hypothetical protein
VVKGRFSFYVPPYLNDSKQSADRNSAVGEFGRRDYSMRGLYGLYYYSSKDASCGDDTPARYKSTTRTDVVIDGKRAGVITEVPAPEEWHCIHDVPTMGVCFPDAGHGRGLRMTLASGDEQGLEIAKQIVKSIEFQ